ncbi:hypothetical protein MGI18_10335 [Bacillus sp. OVS6]|nr:hypothetical protein MGI18_10335 [Bacillus sp. OVS6]
MTTAVIGTIINWLKSEPNVLSKKGSAKTSGLYMYECKKTKMRISNRYARPALNNHKGISMFRSFCGCSGKEQAYNKQQEKPSEISHRWAPNM